MYAVFRSGGKQYRAAEGDVLRVEKLDAEEGATVEFDEVLLVGDGADIEVGSPLLTGKTVSGKVLSQGKSRKVSVVKFRRRQNYLRQGSHRQFFTEVEITSISGKGGKKAAPAESDEAAAAGETARKKSTGKKAASKKTAKKTAKKAAKKKAGKKTAKKAAKKKAARKSD